MSNITDRRCVTFQSGLMAAGLAANSEILQIRWAPVNGGRLNIFAIGFHANVSGTGFTAGDVIIDLRKNTGWTVAGTGGGVVTLANNNFQLDTLQPEAEFPEIRVATTAALGLGTKAVDVGYGVLRSTVTTVATERFINDDSILFDYRQNDHKPVVINNQEGFTIRATVPATGTWNFAGFIACGVST